MFSWYKYLIVSLFFPASVFGVGIFFRLRLFLIVAYLYFLISQNTLADPKVPNRNIICTMDAVRGDFLGPPHGTTPTAVKANKTKLRSFKKHVFVALNLTVHAYFMSPLRRAGGHIVFGVDPVGVGGVGVAFCLHDIS